MLNPYVSVYINTNAVKIIFNIHIEERVDNSYRMLSKIISHNNVELIFFSICSEEYFK